MNGFDGGPVAALVRRGQTMSAVLGSMLVTSHSNDTLRDEDEQFRRLVEEVEDYAIFMLDLDGHVRTWNKGASRIKGYDEAEIVGEHFSIFYSDDAVEDGVPDRLLQRAADEGRTEHEGWRVRKDGSRFWANVTITALSDGDELTGFAKVTRDLTERVRHERRLEQLAHAVSHDLRQPLRTMTVNLELIERSMADEFGEEDREVLDEAIVGAKRMQGMIDGLLQYARVEASGITFQPVECASIVDDVIHDLDALIKERGADVTVESLPVVRGNPDQLHVVFQNLVENAIKYGGDSPRVRVYSEQSGQGWRISVTDDGVGILPRKTADIFELFERSHRVEESDGIGIGLALCKQIVEQHAGTIDVESEPGVGSTFSVTLPAASER